jgi:hypothetical protein
MTARRDLKKRVRERQAATGERYTAALQEVLQARSERQVPVVELVDLTETAAELGLHSRAVISPTLIRQVDGRVVLQRIRDVLLASEGDPRTALFRGVLLRGERLPPRPLTSGHTVMDAQQFLEHAREAVAGVRTLGIFLSVPVPAGEQMLGVVAGLWGLPIEPWMPFAPTLILDSAENMIRDHADILHRATPSPGRR